MEHTTYEKRAGAISDKGLLYEINLVMLAVLISTIKKHSLKLANNIALAGDFDDMAANFKCLSEDGQQINKTVFIQAKHKENLNKKIKEIDKEKGDFSLLKYFNSYCEILNNKQKLQTLGFNIDDADFVLYTNTEFDKSIQNYFTNVQPGCILDLLVTNSAGCYKINTANPVALKTCMQMLSNSQHDASVKTAFLKSIWFCVGQGNVLDIEKRNKELIITRFKETNIDIIDNIYQKSLQYLQKWFRKTGIVNFLSEKDDEFFLQFCAYVEKEIGKLMHTKLLQIFEKKMQFSDISLTTLIETFKCENIVLVKSMEGATDISVTKIFQVLNILNLQYLYVDSQFVRVDFVNNLRVYIENYNEQKTIVLKLNTEQDLDLCDAILESVRQNSLMKIAVVQDFDKISDIKLRINDKTSCRDLTDDCKLRVLESKISFFGTLIVLKKLVGYQFEISDKLLRDLLLHKKIAIGELTNYISDVFNYYIPRKLVCQPLSQNIFTYLSNEKNDIVILNTSSEDLASLSIYNNVRNAQFFPEPVTPGSNVFISVDENEVDIENPQFMASCGNRKNIHYIQSINSCLLLSKCAKSIESLRKFIRKDTTFQFCEVDFVELCYTNKIVIISDVAGMGKSTFLSSISNIISKKYPELWIVRVDLVNHAKVLSEMSFERQLTKQHILKLLLDAIEITEMKHSKELFLIMFELGRVIILFDGFDEISASYNKIVLNLVRSLLSEFNIRKIFLTTRPHEQLQVENTLNALSFNLLELDFTEQVNFIQKLWKHYPERGEKNQAVLFLRKIKTLTTRGDIDVCAIPLQLKMVAECYPELNNEVQKIIQEKDLKWNLSFLYESFIAKKINIYCEEKLKLRIFIPQIRNVVNEIKGKAMILNSLLAIDLILGEDQNKVLLQTEIEIVNSIKTQYSNNKIVSVNPKENEIIAVGIVKHIFSGGSQFLHRTFAEFLASSFLLNKIFSTTNPDFFNILLKYVLSDDRCIVLRMFINGILENSQIEACTTVGDMFVEFYSTENDPEFNALYVCAREQRLHIVLYLLKCLKKSSKNASLIKNMLTFKSNYNFLWHIIAENNANVLNYPDVEVNTSVENQIRDALIAINVYVDIKSDMYSLPLIHGLEYHGSEAIVDYMFFYEESAYHVDSIDNKGNSVLHKAVKSGNESLLQYLLDQGANVSLKNVERETAMHLIAKTGNKEMCNFMLDFSSSVADQNLKGDTPLHIASKFGNMDICEILACYTEHRFLKNKNNESALHVAVERDDLEMCDLFVRRGFDINSKNTKGDTALHICASKGNVEILNLLLDEKNVNTYSTNNKGENVLHISAKLGGIELCKNLLKHNMTSNSKNKEGDTPLHLAARRGHLELCKMLHETGNGDLFSRNNEGDNVLHITAKIGYVKLCYYFCQYINDLDFQNNAGDTALIIAAKIGNMKLCRLLVDKGANVNCVNYNGDSALFQAATIGNLPMCMYLVNRGADVNYSNFEGQSVLNIATNRGDIALCMYLIGKGADLYFKNYESETALHLAVKNNNINMAIFLVKRNAKIDEQNNDGNTALIIAAKQKALEMCIYLIKNGANIYLFNHEGDTVLHIAARNSDAKLCMYVYERNKDKYIQNCNGDTAMHVAVKESNLNVCLFFVSSDFNLPSQNNEGDTFYHIAAKKRIYTIFSKFVSDNKILSIKNYMGETVLDLTKKYHV